MNLKAIYKRVVRSSTLFYYMDLPQIHEKSFYTLLDPLPHVNYFSTGKKL